MTALFPKPNMRTARSTEPCCSLLVKTRIGGAPKRPCCSTSHPDRSSSRWRADARHTTCAIESRCDERETRRLRQAENVFQPLADNLFDDGFGRPTGVNRRILVPCRCQPIRRHCRGKRAANDPAKEAAAGAVDDPALDVANEIVDDLRWSCNEASRREQELQRSGIACARASRSRSCR